MSALEPERYARIIIAGIVANAIEDLQVSPGSLEALQGQREASTSNRERRRLTRQIYALRQQLQRREAAREFLHSEQCRLMLGVLGYPHPEKRIAEILAQTEAA